jgi:hypothetical protein
MPHRTGLEADRCVAWAVLFLAQGALWTWLGMPWAAVLSFGFAADAVRSVSVTWW